MTINVYLQTKGDLTSKGDHYFITAYIYRYKSAIDYFIDASLKEQNIDRKSKSLTEMTVPQKRKLLIETTTYLPYQFSYLYFDKKSITNEKLFEDIALSLLEFETLTGEELRGLIDGKRPERKDDDDSDTPKASAVPSAGKASPKKKDDPVAGGDAEPQPEG